MKYAEHLTGCDLIARAGVCQSYSLMRGEEVVARLTRVPNPHVEADGAICFRCEYGEEPWELQVHRGGRLRKPSYRVLRSGRTVAKLQEQVLFPAVIEFSDGVYLSCRRGISRTWTVRSGDGLLAATARPGELTGEAELRVQPSVDEGRVVAIRLLLRDVFLRETG